MPVKKQKSPVSLTGAGNKETVTISAPAFSIARVDIYGDSILVSNAFAQENQIAIAATFAAVDKPKRGSAKPPKDFHKEYLGSLHQSTEGWYGIPCVAFRSAMIRAAQLCGVEMTQAKMCVFVLPDGVDKEGNGLVKITKGKPEMFKVPTRNKGGGMDIRARGKFVTGWEATVSIRFDSDFMSQTSVVNLLNRAGGQVGVGAGRPFSTASGGQGWGTFKLVANEARKVA